MRWLGIAAAVVGICAATAAQARDPVILISLDGFRADYIWRGITPNLTALAAGGVRAERMIPVFPSVTMPNHQSMITGRYPDGHGITANEFEDPVMGVYDNATADDPKWYGEAEMIWQTAEKAGLKTQSIHWPGPSGKVPGLIPGHWTAYQESMTDDDKVAEVLKFMDAPEAERPALVLMHFGEVDENGHRFGPDSAQVNAAVTAVDTAVGKISQGLKARGVHANLIIVSDHGMYPTPRQNLLVMDQAYDLKGGHLISVGAVGFVALPKGPAAAGVKAALTSPHDNMTCWARADIPARYHLGKNPRVGDVVCAMNPGWNVTDAKKLPLWQKMLAADHQYGNHGYDNSLPEMGALFIANGPGFKSGLVVKPFINLDVYPLTARLLGVTPQPNDGRMADVQAMLAR